MFDNLMQSLNLNLLSEFKFSSFSKPSSPLVLLSLSPPLPPPTYNYRSTTHQLPSHHMSMTTTITSYLAPPPPRLPQTYLYPTHHPITTASPITHPIHQLFRYYHHTPLPPSVHYNCYLDLHHMNHTTTFSK